MKPNNTPGAITPEEKAKKLGISVEQFRRLEPGLAEYKLAGNFPKCDLDGNEDCMHEANSPCFWGSMKRRSPLKVPETLPDHILKQLEDIKERRFILILGVDVKTKKVALYIHSKILGFPDGNFQEDDCALCTLEDIDIKDRLLIPNVGTRKGTFISIKYKGISQPFYSQSSKYKTNFTLYLHNARPLEDDFVLSAYRNLRYQYDNVMEKRNAHLIISVNCKKEDLTKDTLNLFGVIELEPEEQSKDLDTPQAKNEAKIPVYNWSIDDNNLAIYSNKNSVGPVSPILFKLFKCLYSCKGKFVKIVQLEKCWDKKPRYQYYLADAMNGLETKLKKGINVQGKIIESKKNTKRKIGAYKLPI